MLLAFGEQEKLSLATTPSSSRPHYRYNKQSHSQINQEHKQGRTSYSSLEGLRHGSLLPNQDQEEEIEELQEQQQQQQQQQRQEVAVDAIREGEDGNNDDREQRGKQGEKQQRPEEAEEKVNSSGAANSNNEDDNDDYNSNQVGDNDKGLQLTKQRQLSSPHDGHPLKQNREVHFQAPHNGLLRSLPNPERSRAASVPARLERPASSRCDIQLESRKSSSPSPTGNEEPTSNAGAAYQEWPMRGFFKLITIGNEVCYGMEFSLEDVQQLCAAAFPLHTSISARPSWRAQPFSACARAENAPSRSKRPRFTEEEDLKLVDLKERRGWSWEDIQRSFPGRSMGSLQVRYSTKLKERNIAS